MRFEWDEAKNRSNRQKHGIAFDLAIEVFGDPFCMTIPDADLEIEQRLWTIGRISDLTVIVVVHTLHDDQGEEIVRVISARKATPRERGAYEEADE